MNMQKKTAGHLRFCRLKCAMSIEQFSDEIPQEEIFSGEIDAPVPEDSIPEYEHYFCPPIDRFILNNLAPVGVQEVEKVHQKKVIRSLFLSFGQFNNGNTIFQRTTNDNGSYRVRGQHAHTIYDHELRLKYGKTRR